MAPLDSGSHTETYVAPSWNEDMPVVSLADAPSLAAGLRAARELSGRTLQDLAEATRVRREYLVALEEGAFDKLPSRPFAIGYARSYARALGLDEETAADRFKAECPDRSAPLAAPVGSELDDVKPKSTPWVVGATVVVSAVVLWNVAQHAMTSKKMLPSDLAAAAQSWQPGQPLTLVRLGAPLPAPKDQTVPDPYITPGMPAADGTEAQLQPVALQQGPTIPVGAAFNPKGVIYGAEPNASSVTVQAIKPAAVVLRTADGTVYFARQLAAGEAYRAPLQNGLVLDVSDPVAFSVYFNGEYHGNLPQTVTPLGQLNSQAAALAAQAQRAAAAAAQANQAAIETEPADNDAG